MKVCQQDTFTCNTKAPNEAREHVFGAAGRCAAGDLHGEHVIGR